MANLEHMPSFKKYNYHAKLPIVVFMLIAGNITRQRWMQSFASKGKFRGCDYNKAKNALFIEYIDIVNTNIYKSFELS